MYADMLLGKEADATNACGGMGWAQWPLAGLERREGPSGQHTTMEGGSLSLH